MQIRNDIDLFLGSDLQTSAAVDNVANQEASGLVSWTVRLGSKIIVPSTLEPTIILKDNAGNEIDPSTLILVGVSVPGIVRRWLGQFAYRPFYNKSVTDQGSLLNAQGLRQTLNTGAVVRGGQSIIVAFTGPTAIDFTRSDLSLTIPVTEVVDA